MTTEESIARMTILRNELASGLVHKTSYKFKRMRKDQPCYCAIGWANQSLINHGIEPDIPEPFNSTLRSSPMLRVQFGYAFQATEMGSLVEYNDGEHTFTKVIEYIDRIIARNKVL